MSMFFRVILSGGEEVPPVATAASGIGTLTFTHVHSDLYTLDYQITETDIDFDGFAGIAAQTPDTADT